MREMKVLKKFVFGIVLLGGLSVVALAQKDQKPPPPKEKPPVVKPQPKPPPDNSNKGHHGGEALVSWKRQDVQA